MTFPPRNTTLLLLALLSLASSLLSVPVSIVALVLVAVVFLVLREYDDREAQRLEVKAKAQVVQHYNSLDQRLIDVEKKVKFIDQQKAWSK